ncbi:hypothetical protein K1T71_009200 [Dendrolimus kikuchii]|uniref:Uncharacterized protein n=1 Tax=Dendrolimus kikuchii TaxID=765133 RepID=A0ACC1CUF0_9NEOP|nr:hypothetical protein K1T71_009200 [Dendrolimus kikuchii]
MQETRKRNIQNDKKNQNLVNDSKINGIQNKSKLNENLKLKILSRTVVIFALLIVVYYTQHGDKIKPFAKQSELLPGKGQIVECSTEYMKEVDKFEGCFPKACKRFVTDKVVSVREAEDLLAVAKKGLKIGRSSGGASILDLHSGALSMGQHFINIYKIEEVKNLFTEQDFNTYRAQTTAPFGLILTHLTSFFDIHSSCHARSWRKIIETYKSFHYTTLLYLSDYDIDFKGGRFVFIDEKFNRTIEPRKARLSMFTSGKENLHYVEKVTSGVRYAMTISFTCDKQYAVEDPNANKY